jgi:peptidoglycan/xylan/chitin deacetylase (PgdA/CDA1 family)
MINVPGFSRLQHRLRRDSCRWFGRHPVSIACPTPTISFTFDDFPRSALTVGGAILRESGLIGTYYASLGLMGTMTPTGQIFEIQDLEQLIAEGHELGCHTYSHADAWETRPADFERSIVENQRALKKLAPGAAFPTLSYPISCPRPQTKCCTEKYFPCSRGAGQGFNVGMTDANYLNAFFLEQSRDDFDAIKRVIDGTVNARGWLIFATHDVSDSPTRFGCAPALFESVVHYAVKSGATILPVFQAWQASQPEVRQWLSLTEAVGGLNGTR